MRQIKRQLGMAVVLAAILGASAPAAPAGAAGVLVLDHGKVRAYNDPAVPSGGAAGWVASLAGSGCSTCASPRGASASARRSDPVKAAIRRALAASQIDQAQASAYRATYSGAVGLRSRLGLTGKRELGYVVDTIRQLAKSGRLSAARMPALFLMLQRNREWWGSKGAPGSGARVRFGKSLLIFQYYPGHGLQIQPLANFGAANGYWYANKDKSLRTLVDELVSIRVSRSSFTTWEYYFHFGGGSPPWMSGMAQATAVQALTRASTRLSDPTLLAIAREGLGAFEQRTPVGARVPGRLRRLVRALQLQPQPRGAERHAAVADRAPDVRHADRRPSWRGAVRAGRPHRSRADRLLRHRCLVALQPLGGPSRRGGQPQLPHAQPRLRPPPVQLTSADPYCTAADNFTRYLSEDPSLTPFGPAPAPARAGRGVSFHFTLSKVGRVGITVSAGRAHLPLDERGLLPRQALLPLGAAPPQARAHLRLQAVRA